MTGRTDGDGEEKRKFGIFCSMTVHQSSQQIGGLEQSHASEEVFEKLTIKTSFVPHDKMSKRTKFTYKYLQSRGEPITREIIRKRSDETLEATVFIYLSSANTHIVARYITAQDKSLNDEGRAFIGFDSNEINGMQQRRWPRVVQECEDEEAFVRGQRFREELVLFDSTIKHLRDDPEGKGKDPPLDIRANST
ncbi:hypothetical protein C0J52_25219 [Blattella germanica]|nr:hypothetical protein C0J52_25219 [Blattella germanica]